jgi:hypothetical protein
VIAAAPRVHRNFDEFLAKKNSIAKSSYSTEPGLLSIHSWRASAKYPAMPLCRTDTLLT